MAPMVKEKGVVHAEVRSVCTLLLVASIFPLATAAAAAPRKKGVIKLVVLKIRPHQVVVGAAGSMACVRKIKAEPRSTIPINASVNGINNAIESIANADGNTLNSPTIRKINQTWLDSHTGPRALFISWIWRLAWGPTANRFQMPAPKSAPPSTAYAMRPNQRILRAIKATDIRHLPFLAAG